MYSPECSNKHGNSLHTSSSKNLLKEWTLYNLILGFLNWGQPVSYGHIKVFKWTLKRNCKWISMHKQRLIHNGTIETLISSKLWKISSFFLFERCLILIFSRLLLICKKCASHFCREPWNENKQKHGSLIHTWFQTNLLKVTIVDQTLTSLHGGSLDVLLQSLLRISFTSNVQGFICIYIFYIFEKIKLNYLNPAQYTNII